MLHNLLKVAIRNFFREKFYTLLNVTGLAVGISVVLLITNNQSGLTLVNAI